MLNAFVRFLSFLQNSVPQSLGPTDGSFSFPGTGGQIPGLPQPSGVGFPAGPDLSKEQLPSIGGLHGQGFPGMTGVPTGIPASQGLPAIPGMPTGDLSSQGIPAMSGVHTGVPSSQDLPGVSGASTGVLSSRGLSGISGIPTGIPSSSQALPGVQGLPTGSPSSQGLVPSSVGVSVPGSTGGGVMTVEPGSVLGSVGPMKLGPVDEGAGVMTPGSVKGGVGALVAGDAERYEENSIMPPCGSAEEIGVQQIQGKGLPPNIPNADLLVSEDFMQDTWTRTSFIHLSA